MNIWTATRQQVTRFYIHTSETLSPQDIHIGLPGWDSLSPIQRFLVYKGTGVCRLDIRLAFKIRTHTQNLGNIYSILPLPWSQNSLNYFTITHSFHEHQVSIHPHKNRVVKQNQEWCFMNCIVQHVKNCRLALHLASLLPIPTLPGAKLI